MKRGGSKMAYIEQFNLLSPCYKDGEHRASDFRIGGAKPIKKEKTKKPSTTKKVKKVKKATSSKQRGGSSCGASPSVAEMGVVATPASLEPSKSELAWDNRMTGGATNGNAVAVPPNGNTLTKPNQVNNVSTYLNKLKDVVFDKNITNGFAIVVERTSENPTNSKQDKYKIKVIETKNNTPSMSVLVEKSFSDILQTVRDTSSNVFPLKKEGNNNSKIQENAKTGANNPIGAVNYNISSNNNLVLPAPAPAAVGGRKRKNNHK